MIFPHPSSEDLSESNMAEITPCALYSAATSSAFCNKSVRRVLDQLTRKPKGQRGYIVLGTVDSRSQIYRIEYRNTMEEHEVVFARGVVRTPAQWAWRVSLFHICGFGWSVRVLLPCSSQVSTDVFRQRFWFFLYFFLQHTLTSEL